MDGKFSTHSQVKDESLYQNPGNSSSEDSDLRCPYSIIAGDHDTSSHIPSFPI